MKYYSKHTNGFYIDEIHDNIPGDAVIITDDLYAALHTGQSTGKVIQFDDVTKLPTLIDLQHIADIPNNPIVARSYLASTDWYYIRNLETGMVIPNDVLLQRAAARAVLATAVN
jgi:hypothetical protein